MCGATFVRPEDVTIAAGRKTGGKDFVKGHAKVGGRKKLSEEQLEIKRMLESQPGTLLLAKYAMMEYPDLKEFIKSAKAGEKSVQTIELLIACILEHGIEKCDLMKLSWFVDRLFSKHDDLAVDSGKPKLIIQMPNNV